MELLRAAISAARGQTERLESFVRVAIKSLARQQSAHPNTADVRPSGVLAPTNSDGSGTSKSAA